MQATANPRPERDYARVAWTTIIVAFGLFIVLGVAACVLIFRVRDLALSQPKRPAVLITYTRGVDIVRSEMVQPEQPAPPETVLYQGDTVRVPNSVEPGIAASLRLFDGSTIDLWPGSIVTLDQVQTTRFNDRNQRVQVRLVRGLIRLNLVPSSSRLYADVDYSVLVERPGANLEQAALDLGGTYRIRLLAADAPTTSAAEAAAQGVLIDSEYVVEKGRIVLAYGTAIQRIEAGQKLRTDGALLGEPKAAEWDFIRDGDFSAYTQAEYNNTTIVSSTADLVRSDTWYVYGEQSPGATIDGFFAIVSGCLERSVGQAPDDCATPVPHVAKFFRDTPALDAKSFKTAITQTIGLDVTPYEVLRLEFDGRIVFQSLNRAGVIGEECALGATIRYTNQNDDPGSFFFCFYGRDEEGTPDTISNKPFIRSIYMPQGEWTAQSLDLTTIGDMRRLDAIELYGNGHDYHAEVANVSLIGE